MSQRHTILSNEFAYGGKRVAFYGADSSTIEAARFLKDNTELIPVLVGNYFSLQDTADMSRISLKNIEIIKPDSILNNLPAAGKNINPLITAIYAAADKKDLSSPLLFPIALLNSGIADSYFLPNDINFWKLIRSISTEIGNHLSGFHLLASDSNEHILLFSDTCINPEPEPETLAEIAIESAESFSRITGRESKTALLSFSTKGSAKHPLAEKIQTALELARRKSSEMIIDGELQFDAAAVPEISARKAPGNILNGETNVFIFPNLNAARSAYQIARSIGKYKTYGGFIQGFDIPIVLNDYKSNAAEIAETAIISAVFYDTRIKSRQL